MGSMDYKSITLPSTHLGIGPVTKVAVDSAIEIANEYSVPLFLIASRNQIECSAQGGGYVNNWSTESFSSYVRSRDKNNKIILARDHGGPWHNDWELHNGISASDAMKRAKESYFHDISNGFSYIHVDPVRDIAGPIDLNTTLERAFELIEYCYKIAQTQGKTICYEIGTEEQSESPKDNLEELNLMVSRISDFCKKNNFPLPSYTVVQIGTKVKETQNVGSFPKEEGDFESFLNSSGILDICRLCHDKNISIKAHNADYLPAESLKLFPKIGIHAANVAPEFGVAESNSLLRLFRQKRENSCAEQFLEMAYNSMKWKKWLKPNSLLNDETKSVLAGHYIFSKPGFSTLMDRFYTDAKMTPEETENYLKKDVKESIMRYVRNFNLI